MTNKHDPAFPKYPWSQEDFGIAYPGLTKRELLAAMFVAAILSRHGGNCEESAVRHADALIKELSKDCK